MFAASSLSGCLEGFVCIGRDLVEDHLEGDAKRERKPRRILATQLANL